MSASPEHGRLRDECSNEHWFTTLKRERTQIEPWRRECNEEQPKRALGALTRAQFAKQLAVDAVTIPEDCNAFRY